MAHSCLFRERSLGTGLASARNPGKRRSNSGHLIPWKGTPMPSKRFIASAIASIGLVAPLTQPIRALAQSPYVRYEDRREDRREDQREDQRKEVQLNVPRTAAGAIDTQKLIAELRAFFRDAVREGSIRARGLTAQERTEIARLVQQLAGDLRLERVRLRQEDDRLRVELRAEREVRAERREDRHEDRGKAPREDRREDRREDMRADRRENRPERVARVERIERIERPERAERAERPERVERAERPERVERAERPERVERAERAERVERPERSGRH